MKLDFSATGWARVVAGVLGGTIFCIGAAMFIASFRFHEMSEARFRYSMMVNTFLPMGLAAPALFMLLYKMRQLAMAHREISIIASTDSLTAVLNRGAFKMLVDAYLQQAMRQPAHNAGAFLVIDADHFKGINDRFGHQKGDVALKIIAQTIQDSLRQGDIVGRIGGEEFGVFLPKTGIAQALTVAERIRLQISEAEFPPNARSHTLSVSVGGAAFGRNANYDDLFRIADECLYSAKASGRNQVIFDSLAA
ncbi:diguanylate cyclase (GGDEF) domain-containing protein [Hoeflea sp. IMCC20628]|uniref:GGDEF domain-containing protein n=1 Tax=Hoeflea sp. IMCC20628 TaxID=1620421 RepID=UPI00063B065B|nr:GGDEF domain-containing protein [Hoeflea sp. IMCC20628]AKH99357.1 diguanylate cyclase (GGDEF) domain-containing protein [Hoeflea sp. IMCC20628]